MRDERGASAVEYALICAGIGLAFIAALWLFGHAAGYFTGTVCEQDGYECEGLVVAAENPVR